MVEGRLTSVGRRGLDSEFGVASDDGGRSGMSRPEVEGRIAGLGLTWYIVLR